MKPTHYFDAYLSHYRNYKPYWNYEDGCVLIGCQQLYQATGRQKYLDFILRYLEDFLQPDGTIRPFEPEKRNIDCFNPGKILFLAERATGNEKYRRAADYLIRHLKEQPRNKNGSFFHKAIYPDQVWLDGLYMAQPFYLEYDIRYGQKQAYDDILMQYRNARRYMRDASTGLYFHGYDAERIQPWADKTTGCSKNFWLRATGWFFMSLADIIELIPSEDKDYAAEFITLFTELAEALLPWRDKETGLFYQVINHPKALGNYTETSGSAMIAYALMKASRLGLPDCDRYGRIGTEMICALHDRKLIARGQALHLTDICSVAGLGYDRDGSLDYYFSERIVEDDAKGVGAFMMAYAQKLMLERREAYAV
ncbi:MAG: glycosyl hydrolase family 88 [Ruminococcus sp.]|nr:glycosyl hydrolase family 88 [Ruminococcus sp.]MBQ8906732.1 glycoside hydrolase family 88 protein [Ruminococcus sp.]